MISWLAAASIATGLPDISHLIDAPRPASITYLDASGSVLGVRGGQIAPPVDINRLPAYVPGAFVAIEDRRFYEHSGFDAIGIARALAADLSHGRIVEGASTITQQLARNLFLTPDQTVERKAQEVVLAVMIEQKYTKRQILSLYLSRVYFGGGAYGLEAAARRFYDKPASRLTVAEAAVLAGVLKSPTNYNPEDQPEHAAARAKLVLQAMEETGVITPAQARQAMLHPAVVRRASATTAAQYFVDWVDAETRHIVGPPKQDMTVETTLSLPLERLAASAVDAGVASERTRGVQQAALISLDGQGRILAFVGGTNYEQSQFDRAVSARRQAGSAWKPFVYLTALEAGRTPATLVVDEPVTIGTWSPRNYENGYLGDITLQTALAQSVNTVAARLADEVGRENVVKVAHRLGIEANINTDPAMALGTTLVTPLEMARAYTPFSNGGAKAEAYGIVRIRAGGRILYQHRDEPRRQVVDNPPLGEMDQMLRDVVAEGTGRRAAIPGYDIAGKTGTTSDYKDAWFCGFSGGFTTVVWMGRDDDQPMRGITGGTGPAVLWRAYMAAALPVVRPSAIPPGPPPVQDPALTTATSPATISPAPGAPPPLGGQTQGTPAPGSDPVNELLARPRPPGAPAPT